LSGFDELPTMAKGGVLTLQEAQLYLANFGGVSERATSVRLNRAIQTGQVPDRHRATGLQPAFLRDELALVRWRVQMRKTAWLFTFTAWTVVATICGNIVTSLFDSGPYRESGPIAGFVQTASARTRSGQDAAGKLSFSESGYDPPYPSGHPELISYPVDPRAPKKAFEYNEDMKTVVAQLRKALQDSDDSFLREFGCLEPSVPNFPVVTPSGHCPPPGSPAFPPGSPGFGLILQGYFAHGGQKSESEFRDWYLKPGNEPLLFQSGELYSHHAWIFWHQQRLDVFVRGQQGLVFLGPNLGMVRLKELDDARRAYLRGYFDSYGAFFVGCPEDDRDRCQQSHSEWNVAQKQLLSSLWAKLSQPNYPDYHSGGFDIPVIWRDALLPTGGEIFLFAQTAIGLQAIDEFYLGIPTVVEVQYDPPLNQTETSLELKVPSGNLRLKAKRYDVRGYIFRTQPITLESNSDQGPAFDPKTPSNNGGNR
jgi:hypothetical protein